MKKLKSENGAIAILVLISLVFLTTFLISSYVIMSNKMQSQRKVISDTKDIYENYDLNQMYESYFDKSRDGLPDNVEQLEYIESTGTQYIDTGVFPSNNLKINIKVCYTDSNALYMLGSDNAYNAGVNIWWDPNYKTQGYKGIFGTPIMSTGVIPQINVPVTITLQNNKIYVDGQLKGSGTTQDVSKYSKSSIYVFCTHRGGEAKYNASMRLYELQMYDGDTLIRDFIPILDQNNVAYLYDKVEKKFYYNSGTGTFNYKKKDSQNMQLTKVNYIESTGTQYIDTGVKPSNSTKVDIKFMYNSLNGFVYGSRTSGSGSDAHEFMINASGLVFPQFDGQYSEVSSSYNKIGEEYILSNSQSGAYINGNLIKSYNTATFSSKHSMFLFGLNQNGTVEYRKFIGRLYY